MSLIYFVRKNLVFNKSSSRKYQQKGKFEKSGTRSEISNRIHIHICVYIQDKKSTQINIIFYISIFLNWRWTIKTIQQNTQTKVLFILNHFPLKTFIVSFFLLLKSQGYIKMQRTCSQIMTSGNESSYWQFSFSTGILWTWISTNTKVNFNLNCLIIFYVCFF